MKISQCLWYVFYQDFDIIGQRFYCMMPNTCICASKILPAWKLGTENADKKEDTKLDTHCAHVIFVKMTMTLPLPPMKVSRYR